MKNKELLLEISYKCNLNCIHCSSVGIDSDCKIKIEDIPKLVNLDEIEIVRISGGEPLLNEDLLDYAKYFYDNDVRVVLQTNGTCQIKDEIYYNVDEIWFSLYGNEVIHNSITMSKSYKDLIENIDYSSFNVEDIVIQSPVFNRLQIESVISEMEKISETIGDDLKLRLFALLNQGRCNIALPLEEQIGIANKIKNRYSNIDITCSLDESKCNYENKLVLKPDGSLINCASHKHNKKLCKK